METPTFVKARRQVFTPVRYNFQVQLGEDAIGDVIKAARLSRGCLMRSEPKEIGTKSHCERLF